MKKLSPMHGLLSFAVLLAVSCGGKQKIPEPKAPEPFLPDARSCPGAMPGENLQVTAAMGESNFPAVTWTGNRYDISWWDLRNPTPAIYSIGMDRQGYEVRPLKRMSSKGTSAKQHALMSNGKETNIVWQEDGKIFQERIDRPSKPTLLSSKGTDPAAGPFGAVAYVEEGILYFRCDGMVNLKTGALLKPVAVASGGIEDPRIAYNGVYFALVWSESAAGGRHILMQRVSLKGEKLGGEVKVSRVAGQSRKPVIGWAGKNFAVAWTNAAPAGQNPQNRYRIFIAIVPEVGDRPLTTKQLKLAGSAARVAIAATGKEYGLAWVGSKENRGSAVYLQRLNLEGEPLGETIEVTDGVPFVCSSPDVAWDGSGYVVVWHDERGQVDTEVYMALVECGEESDTPPDQPETSKEEAPSEPSDGLPGLKEAF